MYSFVITGRLKPYVRMTRLGQYVDAQAKEYKASQSAIAWQYKKRMLECSWAMLPERTPLSAHILVEAPKRLHASDLDNTVKAVLDAAQGVVFKNDLWVDEIHAGRRLGMEYRALIRIGIAQNQ